MALTGRAGLLALLGALVVGLLAPAWWGLLLVTGLLVVLVAVDVALAGSVRALHLDRSGDVAVRLGEPAAVSLRVGNVSARRLRGRVRDAWPPSAGRHPATP